MFLDVDVALVKLATYLRELLKQNLLRYPLCSKYDTTERHHNWLSVSGGQTLVLLSLSTLERNSSRGLGAPESELGTFVFMSCGSLDVRPHLLDGLIEAG